MSEKAATQSKDRREFLIKAGLGLGFAGLAVQTAAGLRSLVPNVTAQPPTLIRLGPVEEIADGVRFFPEYRLFLLKNRGRAYAFSAVCTHLGCTVRAERLESEETAVVGGMSLRLSHRFLCPCHGSIYRGDGSNLSGPAPKPLPWYRLAISPEDGQLVVDLAREVRPGFTLVIG